jgi:hypothetical protein
MKQRNQRYPITSDVASFFFLLLMMLVTGFVAGLLEGAARDRIFIENIAGFGSYYPFFIILFFPMVETLLFQALPAVVSQIYIRQQVWRWLIIVVPFGLAHYNSEAISGTLFNGLTGGIILGYIYLKYMERSHCRAMLVTWSLHAATNACAILAEMV